MNRRLMGTILGLLLLLAQPVLAERLRLAMDPSTNHFHALREFLFIEGYWEEEMDAVLEPLDGRLDRNHGTPDAHLVQDLDDIRGLRPLPEGVIEFLHRRHRVIYLAAGEDRLLLGISYWVEAENRQDHPADFHYEKFDLIAGSVQVLPGEDDPQASFTEFLQAHGSFLGAIIRLLVMGAAVMIFLALRLRRQPGPSIDPMVAAQRFRADARIFLVTGLAWVILLAAAYGLMHFSARIQFVEIAAASDSITLGMTRRFALMPDQMRLLSFCLAAGLVAVTTILLGIWSGAFSHPRFVSADTDGRAAHD